jgi:hypothetical protein
VLVAALKAWPISVGFAGPESALVSTKRDPDRLPTTVGVNFTVMEQTDSGERRTLAQPSCVIEKSETVPPVNDAGPSRRVPVPVLRIVTALLMLVPTC